MVRPVCLLSDSMLEFLLGGTDWLEAVDFAGLVALIKASRRFHAVIVNHAEYQKQVQRREDLEADTHSAEEEAAREAEEEEQLIAMDHEWWELYGSDSS